MALHYAVLYPATCQQCFHAAIIGMGNTVRFLSRGDGHKADVKVMQLLLEGGVGWKAELDQKKIQHGARSHRHSARQLVRSYPDEKMRNFCGASGG